MEPTGQLVASSELDIGDDPMELKLPFIAVRSSFYTGTQRASNVRGETFLLYEIESFCCVAVEK